MLVVTFAPQSDTYAAAAGEYSAIWRDEGARIVAGMEIHTSLRFAESAIDATVFEGISHSHPLSLRASYSRSVKLGTLIHELGHRLVAAARNPRVAFTTDPPGSPELHRNLDLFLFDLWTDLYGSDFAEEQVAVERARTAMYAAAWDWALGMDRVARAAEFQRSLVFDEP
jgi:hypothetical protein